MIDYVKISDPESTPITWWKDVFPTPREWLFSPRMNILWGRNGSGKSTLLKLIARLLHCEQGGISTVTQHSIQELYGGKRFSRDKAFTMGVEISHNGMAATYYDPTNAVGLVGGMAAFDYDFGMIGALNASLRVSSGETALWRLGNIMDRYTPEVVYKAKPHKEDEELVASLLKASFEGGPRTILMDEPDANLDWPTKLDLWARLNILANHGKFQLIIATHSICALRLLHATYIEVPEPGYLAETRAVAIKAGFLSEEPTTDEQLRSQLLDLKARPEKKTRRRKGEEK